MIVFKVFRFFKMENHKIQTRPYKYRKANSINISLRIQKILFFKEFQGFSWKMC